MLLSPHMLADLVFRLTRLANRLPRGGLIVTRLMPRLVPGLRNYPIPTKYGPIVCDLREWVCWPLVKYGEYPHWKDDEEILPRLGITRETVVLDIGANLGVMAMQFARMARHVHAFEPAPRALRFLRQNVACLTNVTVHPIAVGNHDGVATFSEHWKLDESAFAEDGIEVRVRTIDSLRIDAQFIKIDVEGFEHVVLEGATETLKKGPTLFFEALDEEALRKSSAVIWKANAAYVIRHVGGDSFNYVAIVDGDSGLSDR